MNSLLVITNVAVLPAVYVAARRKLYLEFFVFINLFWASSAYHLCDAFEICVLPSKAHKWLDFMFAFLSAAVIVVYYMNFYNREYKYILFLWLVLATAIAYVVWGFTLLALGVLILILCACALFRWYNGGMAHFYWHELFILAALVSVGLVIFVFFNSNHDNYWLVHSVWHVVIMLSILVGLFVKKPPEPHKAHPGCRACKQSEEDWLMTGCNQSDVLPLQDAASRRDVRCVTSSRHACHHRSSSGLGVYGDIHV